MREQMKISDLLSSASDRIARSRALQLMSFSILVFLFVLAFISLAELFFPISEKNAFKISLGLLGALLAACFASAIAARIKSPSSRDVALMIEAQRPELMDSLVCALEKERLDNSQKGIFDDEIIASVTAQSKLDESIRKLLRKNRRRARIVVSFLISLCLALFISRFDFAEKSLNRAKELAGKIEPGIIVEPGSVELEAHSNLKVKAFISRWDKNAFLVSKSGESEQRFKMIPGPDGTPEFNFYDLKSPFEYRVETDVLESEIFNVSIYEPPRLDKFRMTVVPPEYTMKNRESFEKIGSISAPIGSIVEFRLSAENTSSIFMIGSDGTSKAFSKAAGGESPYEFNLLLSKDNELFIRLEDAKGHKVNTEKFEIKAVPDLPPVVEILTPQNEISAKPSDSIPFKLATCDDYGVKSLSFTYSASGSPLITSKLYPDSSQPEKAPLKIFSEHMLDISKTKCQPGDVIVCHFTASDNKNPVPNQSRSEIVFIEIKEDFEKPESDGAGKKEKIDINKLTAELKRLVRMTYDLMAIPSDSEETDKMFSEITKNMAALRLDGRAIFDKVMSKLPAQALKSDPLIAKFAKALEEVENAEKLLRARNASDSLPPQQRALSLFATIAQELEKNTPTGKEGEGEGEGDKNDPKKGEEKKKSLKDVLANLKKALSECASLAGRQTALNNQMETLPQSEKAGAEHMQASSKQTEISEEVHKIASDLAEDGIAQRAASELERTSDEMNGASRALQDALSDEALQRGKIAHASLLSSMDLIRQKIRNLISDKIDSISASAKSLSGKESDAAAASRGADKSGESKGEASEKMRNSQNSILEKARDLFSESDALSDEIADEFPDAAKKLDSARQNSSEIEKQMKKASNSLLYAKFAKAAEFQDSASRELAKFADSISQAKSSIPKMSQEDVLELMRKIRSADEALGGGEKESEKSGKSETAKNSKGTASAIGRDISSAGEDLGLVELKDLGRALQDLPSDGENSQNMIARRILAEADGVLQSYLLKFEIGRRTELRRKISSPPEKYRGLVEEYFKSLSE